MYKNVLKPLTDFFIALLSLLLVSPLFIFVMLMLAISNQGKPFFFQKRPGKNGEIFTIIKFKTMKIKNVKTVNYYPITKDSHGLGKLSAKRLSTKFHS